MKKTDNKQKLFEMMEVLNPDFRQDEAIVQSSTSATTPPTKTVSQPADVKRLSQATQNTASVQKAGQQINTSSEFPEAFRVWFSSLGYKPDNPAISIMKVKSEIEKVMRSMGYK